MSYNNGQGMRLGPEPEFGKPLAKNEPPSLNDNMTNFSGNSGGSNPSTSISEVGTQAGWGVGLAVMALVVIGVFIALYFILWHNHVNEENVQNIIQNKSSKTPSHFASLTVDGQTTLGDSSVDRVNVKSEFESSLIPDGQKTRDLGSSSQHWNDLYVDDIHGVSGIYPNDDCLIVEGQLGFQRKIKKQLIPSGNEYTDVHIPSIESGYVYDLTKDLDGGTSYQMNYFLPQSTGNGKTYEFIAGDDFTLHQHLNNLFFIASGSDKMKGTCILVAEGTEDEEGENNTIGYSTFSDTTNINITPIEPIDQFDNPGVSGGVHEGSRMVFTDFRQGLWNVEASFIVDSDAPVAAYRNPFSSESARLAHQASS